MSAIEKLVIKGFKAFPKEFELTLEGKHLLLYGENGSGKSSIYYALHCLYQSPLKDDAGKKYFNRTDEHGNPNNQHLINLNIDDDDSEISLHFEAPHPFIYKIDKDGYNSELLGCRSPSMKMVEMYYTERGLPIDQDQEWDYSNRFRMVREHDASTSLNILPDNTAVLNLDLIREPPLSTHRPTGTCYFKTQ